MSIQYKLFFATPSPPHFLSRNDGHFAAHCSDSRDPVSPAFSYPLLLEPFLVKLPASSCRLLTVLCVSIVSVTTRLELLLSTTRSSHVPWHMTQGCGLLAAWQVADLFFALRMPKKCGIIIGKHIRVSPLPTKTSKKFSATRLSGFKMDDIALPIVVMRTFPQLSRMFAV